MKYWWQTSSSGHLGAQFTENALWMHPWKCTKHCLGYENSSGAISCVHSKTHKIPFVSWAFHFPQSFWFHSGWTNTQRKQKWTQSYYSLGWGAGDLFFFLWALVSIINYRQKTDLSAFYQKLSRAQTHFQVFMTTLLSHRIIQVCNWENYYSNFK